MIKKCLKRLNLQERLFYFTSSLITIGIIFSLSLSVYTTLFLETHSYHFFIRQLIVGFVGITLMWFISRLNADTFLHYFCMFLLFFSFLAMIILPFLPNSIASSAGGAKRWIRLGFISFSPIEFFKIGFIYFLAWSFARKIDKNKKMTTKEEIKNIIPHGVVFSIVIVIISVFQNDLGQIAVLGAILLIMMAMAGTSFRLIFLGIFGCIVVFFLIIVSSENRIMRIKAWFGGIQDYIFSFLPDNLTKYLQTDPTPLPYQINQSINAINNGGFFGQGLGLGVLKLGFLSEIHTDFVIAGISEEIGFVGICIIIYIFYVIFFEIFRTASKTENKIFYLFCLGIGFMLFFSLLINLYGITSIFPIKGIAIPFLSYGGSGLLANSLAIGLILMISKQRSNV